MILGSVIPPFNLPNGDALRQNFLMQKLRFKLPPPNSLVTFEAAARHLSFTKAAKELNVTRVAASAQVKALENHIGVLLFERMHRAIRLTPAGEVLAQSVSISLNDIAETIESIQTPELGNRLTVAASPSIMTHWLMPRIGEFRDKHPDVDIRFLVSDSYINLAAEGVDVAIRYGDGRWIGTKAMKLARVQHFPVCSPNYLGTRGKLRAPEDLVGEQLLHLGGGYEQQMHWKSWFQAQDVPPPAKLHGLSFDSHHSLVQAAIEGQGVALLGPPLISRHILQGHLIRAIDVPSLLHQYCWLATPEKGPLSSIAQAFCDWIQAAMADDTEQLCEGD